MEKKIERIIIIVLLGIILGAPFIQGCSNKEQEPSQEELVESVTPDFATNIRIQKIKVDEGHGPLYLILYDIGDRTFFTTIKYRAGVCTSEIKMKP